MLSRQVPKGVVMWLLKAHKAEFSVVLALPVTLVFCLGNQGQVEAGDGRRCVSLVSWYFCSSR